MHGFHSGFELDFLRGKEVEQVCLGQYQTQIVFSEEANLSMEGTYIHQIRSED